MLRKLLVFVVLGLIWFGIYVAGVGVIAATPTIARVLLGCTAIAGFSFWIWIANRYL